VSTPARHIHQRYQPSPPPSAPSHGSPWIHRRDVLTQHHAVRLPVLEVEGQGLLHDLGRRHAARHVSPNTNPSQPGGSCHGLTQGATGSFDHYLDTAGTNIVKAGFPTYVISFGWEFNGNYFPWSGQGCAAGDVQYFYDIVTTMPRRPIGTTTPRASAGATIRSRHRR